MSLSSVHKKVRGVVGREAPTGQTLFKSWDAFEKVMSMIWTNARLYNEDGSDIYVLSQELEVCIHPLSLQYGPETHKARNYFTKSLTMPRRM